jgi:hypothetical protein
VPWFFRVLVDKRLREKRSTHELREEARLAHEAASAA